MTQDLAAALLRDVPRYEPDNPLDNAPSMKADPQGDWLPRDAVLAALTAAIDGVDERAGEALRDVTPGPWTLCRLADQTPHSIQASYGCINGLSALFTLAHINVPDEAVVGMTDGAFDCETADANARFIAWCREGVPVLLAQNAALRAERDAADDALVDRYRDPKTGVFKFPTDVAAASSLRTIAEAVAEKLRGAAEYILDGMGIDGPEYVIDPDDDYLDAANSAWVKDVLTRLSAALTTEADNG